MMGGMFPARSGIQGMMGMYGMSGMGGMIGMGGMMNMGMMLGMGSMLGSMMGGLTGGGMSNPYADMPSFMNHPPVHDHHHDFRLVYGINPGNHHDPRLVYGINPGGRDYDPHF